MSIASNQSLLSGSRGKIGKLLTREVKGRTIISSLPDPDMPRTAAQNNNHTQFREASAFAKAAMLDPDVKAYFEQQAKRQKLPNPYTAAVSFKLTDIRQGLKINTRSKRLVIYIRLCQTMNLKRQATKQLTAQSRISNMLTMIS